MGILRGPWAPAFLRSSGGVGPLYQFSFENDATPVPSFDPAEPDQDGTALGFDGNESSVDMSIVADPSWYPGSTQCISRTSDPVGGEFYDFFPGTGGDPNFPALNDYRFDFFFKQEISAVPDPSVMGGLFLMRMGGFSVTAALIDFLVPSIDISHAGGAIQTINAATPGWAAFFASFAAWNDGNWHSYSMRFTSSTFQIIFGVDASTEVTSPVANPPAGTYDLISPTSTFLPGFRMNIGEGNVFRWDYLQCFVDEL